MDNQVNSVIAVAAVVGALATVAAVIVQFVALRSKGNDYASSYSGAVASWIPDKIWLIVALFVAMAFLVGQLTGRTSDSFQLVSIGFLLSLPVGAVAQLLLRTTSMPLRGPVRWGLMTAAPILLAVVAVLAE